MQSLSRQTALRDARPGATGRPLWLRWVGANGLAEALGLGATLALDALILSFVAAQQSVVATALGILLVTATGALEGAVVGLLQWRVLRRPFPRIARRTWLLATIGGALLAWFLGSLPSTLMDMSAQPGAAPMEAPSPLVMYALASGMGLALGPVLGVPQWLALRRHAPGAWIWIPANCLAWALGMPVIFVAVDLAQGLTGSPVALALMLVAGLFAAGAVVGAVHGAALVKLAECADP
jgi:hypothetical protein